MNSKERRVAQTRLSASLNGPIAIAARAVDVVRQTVGHGIAWVGVTATAVADLALTVQATRLRSPVVGRSLACCALVALARPSPCVGNGCRGIPDAGRAEPACSTERKAPWTPGTATIRATSGRRSASRRFRGFVGHLIAYFSINAGLFVLDVLTNRNNWWFYRPLVGWGIAVVIHATVLFGVEGRLGQRWEERKIRELMERDQLHQGT